jgi:type IV secretion system protein VirB4
VQINKLSDALGYCGAGETRADPYLPFIDHVAPQVMLLRDGSVIGTARMVGAPFALLGNADRNGSLIRHTALLNAIADSNVEVWEHLVRHDDVPAMPPRPPEAAPYAAALLADWNSATAPRLRANDWFLTIQVKPRRDPLSTLGRAFAAMGSFRKGAEKPPEASHELVLQLEDAFAMVSGLLRKLRPVRLGTRIDGIAFSELAEAMELIRTTKAFPQPIVDPAGTLGAGLAAHDPICGKGIFEVRYGAAGTDSHYGTMLGITGYPRTVWQDRFDDLLNLDGRFVLTNHIQFFNRAQAQEDLLLLRRLMATGDDPDTEGSEELKAALSRVARGEAVRGLARWSLALHADGEPSDNAELVARSALRRVDRLTAEAKTILAGAGLRVAPESYGTKSAHIAQTPGAPGKNRIRPASIPTDYFATLSPLAGFARGPAAFRWSGPVLRLPTSGGTAFDYDQAVGDVLHQVVIGPNGSGKTVWVGMNIAAVDALVRAGRRRGTQILLDVDESNAQTVLALGGVYTPIRGGGEMSGVAPLRLPNTARVRAMLRSFVAGLVQSEGGAPPSAEEVIGIREGVAFTMNELAPEERSLGVIRRFMGYGEDGAGARLERWCRDCDGDLAWAFDGREHTLDFDVPLAGVDLTGVMDDPLVMPAMGQFLLWLASEQMDGRRCVVWCEEAPAYINRPEFGRMGKATALRARKRNACFVAIAQMPEHLLASEAGTAIIKQARQIIAFPNDKAEEAPYRIGLGFTAPEFQAVRQGMFERRGRPLLIKRADGESTIADFDMGLTEATRRHLAVLSGTTNSVRLLRSIIAKRGMEDPLATLNEFWRRLPEAAA